MHLEDQRGALGLLVTTKLEVLAALERQVRAVLAHGALETQHDLLGRYTESVSHVWKLRHTYS